MIDYMFGPNAGGIKSKISWFGNKYTRNELVSHIEEKNQLNKLRRKTIEKYFKIEEAIKPKRKFRFK